MGMSNLNNLTGLKSHGQKPLQSRSLTGQGYDARGSDPIRSLQPSKELQMLQQYTANQKAAKDQRLLVIAELNKKGKVSFGVGDTVSFFAGKLEAAEAAEAVKLVAELNKKGKVSFGVREGNSDTVSFFAGKLEAAEAVKLIADIEQRKIDLKELSKQEGREVKGGLTGFFNSVGEVSKETAISVVSGIVGETLVTLCGPVGAIVISLGAAAATTKSQENSFAYGMLGGTLFTLCGPVGAIVIPLGVAAAVKLLPDKKSHE